ncbi:FAD-binding oxidoreductase [Vibrio sp. S4M6]|uniref:FAD-binding and (Fe-S)-binding domain-containing protein n=1 Tax=Vibrio sinus TaxID=2946865 RepID=UPI00202A23FE|nr:FAD-binding and (Fe-S)-binding domain-containing protein [Vibrio sinus]MCL9779989.1 FAD-binding oxidoreductase [Vibrio sinus]
MLNPQPDEPYTTLEKNLLSQLQPNQIVTQEEKRLAYGTDASFYRLIPKIVLRLSSLDEVIFSIKQCRKLNLPFTYRAAGTSLSGQAISDSVLITLDDNWRDYKISENGEKITLQPGVIGADANKYLAPYKRKIGPDPASINACKIGGIAANNSSGMCCGTAQNTYKTVESIKVVLNDGTLLDTSCEQSIANFHVARPDIIEGINQLHQETNANHSLVQKILHKYRLKNTTGYSLNSLVDYQDPTDIIEHLMIGSEGTLGFIAEITYNTVVEHTDKATSLFVFANIEQASLAVSAISQSPVAAVELMDGRALQSIADKEGMPSFIKSLNQEASTILIETHAESSRQLDTNIQAVLTKLEGFEIVESVPFTTDTKVVTSLWAMRKGLFPAVGAVRDVGTTVIIEDVAFPVEHLAHGVRDLQALFDKYHYSEAIIFGHALDGNLHFIFTQSFAQESEVERYRQFMDDVAQLVSLKYQGSLKAEHGTGRNMAPYVELEWGKDGYELMKKVKAIFDPDGLINPGVIINENPHAHVEDLKQMPEADPIVDRCIECGFCEPVCPSKSLSLTPRQRIVLYRELRRRQSDNLPHQSLQDSFEYLGIDTCAATGLCAERCPVGINTGELIKSLRSNKYSKFTPIAKWSANHIGFVSASTKFALSSNSVLRRMFGDRMMQSSVNGVRKLTKGSTPYWMPEYPRANSHRLPSSPTSKALSDKPTVVYMPSCVSRSLGQSTSAKDQRSLTQVTLSVLKKAGYEVIIPEQVQQLCCGMPFDSKGMNELADSKFQQLEKRLWEASDQGRLPVLFDTSPCVKSVLERLKKQLDIYEPTQFICAHLVSKLKVTPIDEPVMLHVTCSSKRMGLADEMVNLAQLCAKEVVVPEHVYCCGWAGDKGFMTPELNRSALSSLKQQVPKGCTQGFSNSRTCEIGLSHHSGITYQSIMYLVDAATSK